MTRHETEMHALRKAHIEAKIMRSAERHKRKLELLEYKKAAAKEKIKYLNSLKTTDSGCKL